MPNTKKQQRSAGAELRRRRQGTKQRQQPGKATRPFGSTRTSTLRQLAANPDPDMQKQAAQQELQRRQTGGQRQPGDRAAFRSASDQRVQFYATAPREAIEKKNERERNR